MVKSAPLIAIIGSAPSARGKNQPCEGVVNPFFKLVTDQLWRRREVQQQPSGDVRIQGSGD